jgi:hypothetical protein
MRDLPPRSRPAAGPHRWLGWLAGRLRVPHRELALIGHSAERYVTEKVVFTLLGLLFPPVFSLILVMRVAYGWVSSSPPEPAWRWPSCSSSSSTFRSANAPSKPGRSSLVTSPCTST